MGAAGQQGASLGRAPGADAGGVECPVCFTQCTSDIWVLACGHSFCQACATRLVNNGSCAVCRGPAHKNSVFRVAIGGASSAAVMNRYDPDCSALGGIVVRVRPGGMGAPTGWGGRSRGRPRGQPTISPPFSPRASGPSRSRRWCAGCCTCRPPRPTKSAWCSRRCGCGGRSGQVRAGGRGCAPFLLAPCTTASIAARAVP